MAHELKERQRLPRWMKMKMPKGESYSKVKNLVEQHGLHTICTSGNCPNKGECWSAGTATFKINKAKRTEEAVINNVNELIEKRSKEEGSIITPKMKPIVFGLMTLAEKNNQIDPGKGWDRYDGQRAIDDTEALIQDIAKREITPEMIPEKIKAQIINEYKESLSGKDKNFSGDVQEKLSEEDLNEIDEMFTEKIPSGTAGLRALRRQALGHKMSR